MAALDAYTSTRREYDIWSTPGASFSKKKQNKKNLSPLVILSMKKTMVTKVISELKSISRLKIFRENGPCTLPRLRRQEIQHP